MRTKGVAYFALFLAAACPILCRASMVAACAHETSRDQQAAAGESERCPDELPQPSTPADPCKDLSCFCSHLVLVERDGPTSTFTMDELPTSACPSIVIAVPGAAIDDGLAGRYGLPVIPASVSVVLPLLI